MEVKTGCLIKHRDGTYIGQSYDQMTKKVNMSKTMFGAMRFKDVAEASEWMLNSRFAPPDTERYEYEEVEIVIRKAGKHE